MDGPWCRIDLLGRLILRCDNNILLFFQVWHSVTMVCFLYEWYSELEFNKCFWLHHVQQNYDLSLRSPSCIGIISKFYYGHVSTGNVNLRQFVYRISSIVGQNTQKEIKAFCHVNTMNDSASKIGHDFSK